MADASDTMRYLVKSFDIAPAGTREEGQAAKSLAEVFHDHGLETAEKGFRFATFGKTAYAVFAVVMALAGILSGIAGGALPIVMLVIGALAGILYALELFGIKTLSRIGTPGSSQNVVARHPAASSFDSKKARPIVIIAHYDTPRADIFAMPVLAPIQPYLRLIVHVCMAVDVVAMVFQAIGPLPVLVHSIAWALSIVSSAILLVWGVCGLLQRFVMPYTDGANDNKAGIAALFGVLDRVRPLAGGGYEPEALLDEEGEFLDEEGQAAADEEPVRSRRRASDEERPARRSGARADESSVRVVSRRAAAVRHGAEVVRSLGILPETCELVYEDGKQAPAEDAEASATIASSAAQSSPSPQDTFAAVESVTAPRVHRASEVRKTAEKHQEVVDGATVMISRDALVSGGVPAASADASEADVSAALTETPASEANPATVDDIEAAKDEAADAIMANIVGTSNMLSGSQAPETLRAAKAPAVAEVPAVDMGATSLMEPVPEAAALASVQQQAPRAQQVPAVVQQQPATPVAKAASPVQPLPFRVITSSDEPDAELRTVSANLPRDVAEQSTRVANTLFNDSADSFYDPVESVVNSPAWGTSSFSPVGAGRRILADIPDPAVAAVDPFSVSNIETIGDYNPDDFSQLDFETGTHEAVTPAMLEDMRRRSLDGFSADITEAPSKRGRKAKKGRSGRISQQAAQMKAEMEEQSFNDWLGLEDDFDAKTSGRQIGSWDNFEDDLGSGQPRRSNSGSPTWQGGAARSRRSSRRSGDAARETRQAAMTLGDRELVAHEIWFVLTGASEAEHAGIEDFLKTYRSELRGAYFINLECVGAGRQSLVIEEGAVRHSRAEHRLVNLFGAASQNINRPLALARMGWRDTEATPALRQGCRAVTVCGVENGVPANARWTGDTPEKVDPGMINDLVDVVVEVIKNA